MKQKRIFLEPPTESDSYIRVSIDDDGYTHLKLSDCDRGIWWSFGKPGTRRAIAKIKKVKMIIDQVYDHLTKAGES